MSQVPRALEDSADGERGVIINTARYVLLYDAIE